MIEYQDFEKVDIRTGTILEATDNTKARKPAYVLKIDFGTEIGIKTSSAQLVSSYTKEELIGKQILAVINFESKNIAGVLSEVLVLGVPTQDEKICLVEPVKYNIKNGVKLY
jgi:tRNA-binding protein